MERIVSACIKWQYKEDDIKTVRFIKGKSHAECIKSFSMWDVPRSHRNLDFEELGFWTSKERFVTRKEAYLIAKATEQLKLERSDQILFSEFCLM